MSKTEDYLDSLLNNVSPERKAEAERKRRRTSADFMKDFEDELNDAGMDDDIFGDFNEDEELSGQTGGSFFDNLEGIVNTAKEASARESGKPADSDGSEDAFEVNTLRDDAWTEQQENRTESKREKEEAVSEDVQEILDVLSDLPSKEEISQASKDAGIVQEDELDEESSEKGSGVPGKESGEEKKKEKKGLFQKLASLFSKGEKGDAEDGDASLEDADQKSDTKKDKKDKKKEKKPKKEKKKKEKKEKEKKEKKPPKEKKPKKPKEIDLSPPLPKAPVILIFLMSLSILLLALICSNLVGYSDSISNAKKAYSNGDYVTAYQETAGLSIKEKDAEFQMRATILAVVQSGLLDGINLYNTGQYTMSLNSYICALGRYDTNYENAVLFEVQDKYASLEEQLIGQLGEKFGVSAETARELYALEDRTEYTCRVYDIVKNLGLSE